MSPKAFKFIGFGATDVAKPYEFTGFGAMDVAKSYKFTQRRAYGRILDFNFRGRTENSHEMVLELLTRADFKCELHHVSSLTRLKVSWGQVWPENSPKSKVKCGF